MKLFRFRPDATIPDVTRPGVVDQHGFHRDISSLINDVAGKSLSPQMLKVLQDKSDNGNLASLPEARSIGSSTLQFGPCVGSVGKFIAIGLNYTDHAIETNAPIPAEPVVFNKWTSCISGPNDDIMLPRGSLKTDWEIELGVVIGSRVSYVSEQDALGKVAGYCVINDLSEREYQLERGGQWDKGKGCDTFGPLGPYLVTTDEISDPQNLDMWLEVDGARQQTGNTRTMIFTVAHIISYLSQFMTLYPGDVITTGTPPGVGLGMKPPRYLREGNVVRLGIAGLGEQQQKVVGASAATR